MTAAVPTLVFAALASGVISTFVVTLLVRAAGVGVPEVGFGVWAPRARFKVGHTRVILTPWMFSCWTRVKELEELDEYPDTPGKMFGELHPILRSLILLSGPLAVVAIAVPILGDAALDSFWAGFRQVIGGAVSPTHTGQALLSGFAGVAQSSLLVAAGVLLTKCAAFMLLPIPTLPGGNALMQLLRWRNLKYPASAATLQTLGIFVVLALVVSWSFAILRFLVA